MSGLIALLDYVAAIAKVAASSLDDVIGQATKASTKAAGAVIDDAAVSPKYVQGFEASRELPVIWRIAAQQAAVFAARRAGAVQLRALGHCAPVDARRCIFVF